MNLIQMMYKLVRKLIRQVGYNLTVTKYYKSESYESVVPNATYAPWLSDKSFIKTHRKIQDYTLVDKYRCYELWQLVKETSKLKGALIEVGVWRGGSGALIAKAAKLNGIKDKVYLCDTFAGVVKASSKDSSYKGGEHADTSQKLVEEVVTELGLDNVKILEGIFPDDIGEKIKDKNIRFCHIDVDVYRSAKHVMEWVWSRLEVGGMIVFDDYGFIGCDGITKLVNGERGKKDRIIIHNLNGHAIIVKTSN